MELVFAQQLQPSLHWFHQQEIMKIRTLERWVLRAVHIHYGSINSTTSMKQIFKRTPLQVASDCPHG
ncbi:hypothetical protein ABKN59_002963 [Abortiporus biennis]